jgi:hypothetical protein
VPWTIVRVLLLLLPAAWLPQHNRRTHVVRAAKDLHFNKNMEALKKMQAGADKLATVVGVTLGPKVCTAVAAIAGFPATATAQATTE